MDYYEPRLPCEVTQIGGELADAFGGEFCHIMRGVAHVQAKNIGASIEEFGNGFFGLGGGTEGDDELSLAWHDVEWVMSARPMA